MIQHKQNPAKAFLMRYRALSQKCTALERAIRTAMENATNTTVALKEVCVQSSGGGEMMANAVVSAIDATKVLEDERREANRIMGEIMEAIKAGDADKAERLANRHMINAYENMVKNGLHEAYQKENKE